MTTYNHALSIVKTLQNEGHIAYFAGGWVRDYVMGHPSDDIDIATDAPPEKILDMFPNTVGVGISFGVVIVPIEGIQFEVATFRKDLNYEGGRRPTKIEPTTPQEDAKRRDFTINGMFYDPISDSIYDYVGGKEDIEKRIIRAIGKPFERFEEDRLRMIRAIRLAERFDFHIEPETEQGIIDNAPTLFPAVSMERVWQEFNKMAKYPRFDYAIVSLARVGLLQEIFPELKHLHLNDIKKEVDCFKNYPPNIPTIAYLMELFPKKSAKDMVDLCRYLRASNRDVKLAQLLAHCKQLVESNDTDQYQWSHIYAHPFGRKSLEIIAARFSEEARKQFIETHEKHQRFLQPHIERIQNNTPLVTSEHIAKEGIDPGKTMGSLLKEAEKLAINKDMDNPQEIIELLKHSSLWPQEHE